MILTGQQRVLVSYALTGLSVYQRDEAEKYIADVLRPKREIADTDVNHAIAAALHRVMGRAA